MLRYLSPHGLGVGLCLTLLLYQAGQAASPPAARRVDHYGDPLPPGAVARLGTLRFVHVNANTVALSPDGKVAASGGLEEKKVVIGKKTLHQKDGSEVEIDDALTPTTIRLWDADRGTLLREIPTPDGPVNRLLFGKKGQELYADCGRYLCKWDVGTGKKLWQKETLPEISRQGLFTPEIFLCAGRLLWLHQERIECLVSLEKKKDCYFALQHFLRLWDPNTGRALDTPPGLRSTLAAEGQIGTLILTAAVSPDGRYAGVLTSRAKPLPRDKFNSESWSYTDGRLLVVDLATGKTRHTLPGCKDTTRPVISFNPSLAFSPDSKSLALAAQGEIVLIQLADGRKRKVASYSQEDQRRLTRSGSPWVEFRGTQLVACMPNGAIRAWDASSGREVPAHRHTDAFVKAHKGRTATLVGSSVVLTDAVSGKIVHPYEGHRWTPVARFALHTRSRLLSGDGEHVCFWDTRSWRPVETLEVAEKLMAGRTFYRQEDADEGASWEKGLYVRRREKHLELRDLRTGRIVHPLAGTERLDLSPDEIFGEKIPGTFSAAGNRLLVTQEKFFALFDTNTGKELSRVARPEIEVKSLEWDDATLSPSGTYLAHNLRGERVEIHEVASGKLLRSLQARPAAPGRTRSIVHLHFSDDERVLFGEVHQKLPETAAVKDWRMALILWDVQTGEILQETAEEPTPQPESEPLRAFMRLGIPATVLALSHDRRLIALAGIDSKDIEVREMATGKKRFVLSGHVGPVRSLAFAPDDKQLVSSSEDSTILVWDMQRSLAAARLDKAALRAHWETLAQADAARADRALRALAAAPADALPFLKTHLRPAAAPDAGRVKKLLADLDDDAYQTRVRAFAELERLGANIRTALAKEAQQKNSPEKQRRLRLLRKKAATLPPLFVTPEGMRQWRGLEVLERIGTPEAVRLLRELAAGSPGARLTQEARSILTRLESQAKRSR